MGRVGVEIYEGYHTDPGVITLALHSFIERMVGWGEGVFTHLHTLGGSVRATLYALYAVTCGTPHGQGALGKLSWFFPNGTLTICLCTRGVFQQRRDMQ